MLINTYLVWLFINDNCLGHDEKFCMQSPIQVNNRDIWDDLECAARYNLVTFIYPIKEHASSLSSTCTST